MPVPVRRTCLAVLVAAGLAGCAADGRSPAPPGSPGAAQQASPGPGGAPRPPGAKPAAPPDLAGVRPPARPTPPPPQPARKPNFPRLTAAVFDGLTAETALMLFGTPDQARRRAADNLGATHWIYRKAGCRLEIAFHFSIADNALLAHAYEIGPDDPRAGPVSERLCLHALAMDAPEVAERP